MSPSTVGEAMAWAAERLARSGMPDSPRESAALISFVLGLGRAEIFAQRARPLGFMERVKVRRAVRRRQERVPVAYMAGEVEFYGRPFWVSRDVLIPRPETERLVEVALELLGPAPRQIADIGTGSGNIAVTLALERPGAMVWATDLSRKACRVARRNARRHGVADRVHVLEGDLGEPLGAGSDPLQSWGQTPPMFDLVTANLPYVPRAELGRLEPELGYEPRLALVGGEDGLELYRRFMPQVPGLLRPGGHLVVEIGDDQGKAVLELVAGTESGMGSRPRLRGDDNLRGNDGVRVINDFAGRDRIVVAQWPSS